MALGRTIDAVEVRNIDEHTSTFTVQATPDYTAGDALGTGQSISGAARVAGSGLQIVSLTLVDASNQKFPLDLLFFRDAPSATTDNAAYAPSAADLAKLRAGVQILDTDWVTYGTRAIAYLAPASIIIPDLVATTLYYQPIAQGAFNFAATSDLTVVVGFERL